MSPMEYIPRQSCLAMSYKSSVADIVVSTYNTSDTVQLFNITNDGQVSMWHRAKSNLPAGNRGIIIQINYRRSLLSLIGIDDITLSEGSCLEKSKSFMIPDILSVTMH